MPSWLFIVTDVTVRGKSIRPCLLGICKGTMHTGQFSLSGPVIPMLKILEENSAAKDCTRIEDLPDVCFVIMGQVREER